MVFSSVPLYLDPPNWQQHQNHQQQQQQQQQQLQGNNGTGNHHEINQHRLNIPALPPPAAVQQVGLGGNGPGPARPNSMAERARLAKIPPPEAPLKCPRCDSTNTKFCYFNNYSLTQPRHFCKTCRRYWTRGGALRNVPVGGGCRRNKRSSSGSGAAKSSTSSASTTTSSATTKPSSSLSGMGPAGGGGAGFMASLQSIAQLGMGSLGLNFPGPTALHSSNPTGGLLDQLDHYGASINTSSNINALLSHHHHQVSSFPNFLGGFEIPGSNSFQNVVVGGDDNGDDHVGGKGMTSSLTNISGLMGAGVKMENSSHTEKGLLMGMNSTTSSLQMNVTSSMTTMNDSNNNNNNNNNNSQFWGATGGGGDTGSTSLWTTAAASHLAGLNSSSTTTTSHLL